MTARVVCEDGNAIEVANVPGSLQVKGDMMFQEYFSNPRATMDAFTPDGWFITGDTALTDKSGYINLRGRAKDLIVVNGVNYYPHELENAIEDAKLPGLEPAFTVVFSHRPEGSSTKKVVVIYSPTFDCENVEALRCSIGRNI